ncbi:response regulator [Rubellimicrobium arenae]|uniref:response regulator n=1 Tax=Rubellimicrobium arenae TaxID=2817372 RepID=UPI001B30B9CB|nr:response regulator [Rubellimicrobium arenae]
MQRAPPEPLDGEARLILVVEDEFLIAMELEAVLEESGFRVLGPAATVQAALQLLDQQRPHAAVLDMNLRNETVVPVARVLRRMAVPFAIASAYGAASWPRDEALDGAPSLGKPTSTATLIAAMHEILTTDSGPTTDSGQGRSSTSGS